MKLEKKQIEIVAVSVIFGALALIIAWQLWPSGQAQGKGKGKDAAVSAGTYREQLLKAQMMVKHLPRQRQEVAELQKRVDDVAQTIPLESDQTWLSRQINVIARQTGVGDVSQRFLPAAPSRLSLDGDLKGKYGEKTWEIRMTCGYHELGAFISRLEGASRFLEITDLSVEGNEPHGQRVVLLVHYIVRKG